MTTMEATATFTCASEEGRVEKGEAFETTPERAALLEDRGLAETVAEATDEAAQLANAEDVDLREIEGSGEEGRILVGDVRAALSSENAEA